MIPYLIAVSILPTKNNHHTHSVRSNRSIFFVYDETAVVFLGSLGVNHHGKDSCCDDSLVDVSHQTKKIAIIPSIHAFTAHRIKNPIENDTVKAYVLGTKQVRYNRANKVFLFIMHTKNKEIQPYYISTRTIATYTIYDIYQIIYWHIDK